MILYQGTAKEFSETVDTNTLIKRLEDVFLEKLGRKIPPAEISAYQNSLPAMERVVRRSGVAGDCGVLVEYIIPLTSNRIDFAITGEDDSGNKNLVIVELKQWQTAEATASDGVVKSFVGKSVRETPHPSYQAQSYRLFMTDFNAELSEERIRARSCAYLHNYRQNDPEPLSGDPYTELVAETPIYFQDDQEKLEKFLATHVGKGKGVDILYQLEAGKIRPTKKLIDHISSVIEGNSDFVLLDEQKVAFEKARGVACATDKKSVVIIKGGPGTGKSVISVNLLAQLLKDELNALFIAPNASFRDVLVKRLTADKVSARIRNLFKGSGSFVSTESDTFDALIVDEAHRLKGKGAYMYQGDNQVKDIINAAKTSVFFVDDDQAIRKADLGTRDEIRRVAEEFDAEVSEIELTAQFRCAGAEGYINWISDVLQIEQTANYDGWNQGEYEFKIFSDPNELRSAIKEKASLGRSARVVAGYAWKWTKSGNANAEIEDIAIPEFNFCMPWNSRKVGTTWAIDAAGVGQAGCIHTTQGLEFDYVGVIVGKDLEFNPETQLYRTDFGNYKDVSGKQGLRKEPETLNRFVRNIYKVLMTRGTHGCYVYFEDKEVENYFRSRMKSD